MLYYLHIKRHCVLLLHVFDQQSGPAHFFSCSQASKARVAYHELGLNHSHFKTKDPLQTCSLILLIDFPKR